MKTEKLTQDIIDIVKSGKGDKEIFDKVQSKIDASKKAFNDEFKTYLRLQFLENIILFADKNKNDLWHNFKKFITRL